MGAMEYMWWNLTNFGWTPTTSKRAATILERKAQENGMKIRREENHQTIYLFQEDEE